VGLFLSGFRPALVRVSITAVSSVRWAVNRAALCPATLQRDFCSSSTRPRNRDPSFRGLPHSVRQPGEPLEEKFQGLELLGAKLPRLAPHFAGFGTFGWKSSKAAPTDVGASLAPIAIGAGLEPFEQELPRLVPHSAGFGNFGRKTSKVWKFCSEKFQGLGLFDQKVPRFGALRPKSSKVWKSCTENF